MASRPIRSWFSRRYATFAPVKGLTIDFGKFVTTAGAEVIEANKNWLYSRSILFFNIPLLHTRSRAPTYKVNDMLSLQASVVNGWNDVGIAPDINADKTYGVSADRHTVPTGTNIVATDVLRQGRGGFDATAMTAVAARTRASSSTSSSAQTVRASSGSNLNFDYIKDASPATTTPSARLAMGRYGDQRALALAARGEYVRRTPASAASDQDVMEEVTVGAAFPMGKRFELRTEVRADFASADIFPTRTATRRPIRSPARWRRCRGF